MAPFRSIVAFFVSATAAAAGAHDLGLVLIQRQADAIQGGGQLSDIAQDEWISEGEMLKQFDNTTLRGFINEGRLKLRPDPTNPTLVQYKVETPSVAVSSSSVETPKTPGCYVSTASGCPSRKFGPRAGIWMKDPKVGTNQSEEACAQRMQDYNRWCQIADSRMLFVSQNVQASSSSVLVEHHGAQASGTLQESATGEHNAGILSHVRGLVGRIMGGDQHGEQQATAVGSYTKHVREEPSATRSTYAINAVAKSAKSVKRHSKPNDAPGRSVAAGDEAQAAAAQKASEHVNAPLGVGDVAEATEEQPEPAPEAGASKLVSAGSEALSHSPRSWTNSVNKLIESHAETQTTGTSEVRPVTVDESSSLASETFSSGDDLGGSLDGFGELDAILNEAEQSYSKMQQNIGSTMGGW